MDGSDSDDVPDDGAVEHDSDAYVSDSDGEGDVPTESSLHPSDIENFFKLSRALRILLAGRITKEKLDEADRLIREYCEGLVEVCTASILSLCHFY